MKSDHGIVGLTMMGIMIYDDEVMVTPAAVISFEGEHFNMWNELNQVGLSVVKIAKPYAITITRDTWNTIIGYFQNSFHNMMTLHDFLNRTFAKNPDSLRDE